MMDVGTPLPAAKRLNNHGDLVLNSHLDIAEHGKNEIRKHLTYLHESKDSLAVFRTIPISDAPDKCLFDLCELDPWILLQHRQGGSAHAHITL